MKQYSLAIHMLLPFWPVDIFTFCWTYSFNIFKAGLKPHHRHSLRCFMQRKPLRLASEETIIESYQRITVFIMPKFKALSGAPILGSHLLAPSLDGLFPVEVVSVVHLGAPVVLG